MKINAKLKLRCMVGWMSQWNTCLSNLVKLLSKNETLGSSDIKSGNLTDVQNISQFDRWLTTDNSLKRFPWMDGLMSLKEV